MPKVNRFRIVNFKYDDNKKYIADEIFEMQNHNTLVNLENGGGKSAMLQLALQVMLPNTPLGSRKMSDYFNLNSGTVHILIEWYLDTTGMNQQYLLTGFCCRKGQEGLNYFMYVRPHTGSDEYDIENMPVLSNRREVTGYHEFHRYIRSLSKEPGTRINLFRQNDRKKYRIQLESYNLFEEEFRAIRTINQSEGGIEKFFEKTRTSRQVVERLIIPSIPSGNEEESGVLADSLKKHMDNLKTIPQLQNRIKTYDSFCIRAEDFLLHVRHYAKVYSKHQGFASNIISLENLLRIAHDVSEKKYEECSYKKEEASLKHKELVYKKDSFNYSKHHHEAGFLAEKSAEIKRDKNSLEKHLEGLNTDYKNSLSVNDWLEMNDEKEKLLINKARLKAKQQEKHEWNEQYQKILVTLEYLYNNWLDELKNELEELFGRKSSLEQKIRRQENHKGEIMSEIQNTDNKIYHLNREVERLEADIKKVISFIDGSHSLFLDPQKSLEEMDAAMGEMENEVKKTMEHIENVEKKIQSVETERGRMDIKVVGNRKDKDSMEGELDRIKNDRRLLEQRMKNYEINTSIYKDTIYNKVQALIDNQRAEYNRILSSRLSLENKQLAFSEGGDYIPDYAIKKLADLFKENDINAIPGSVWLTNQRSELKRKLAEENPYLPYSVIINEKSIDSVKYLAKKITGCVEGYPVWILTGGGEAIVYPGNDDGKNQKSYGLFDRKIYIFNSEAVDLSVDVKKFKEYAQGLKDKITRMGDSIKIKQDELSALEKLGNDIDTFIEKNPEALVAGKEEALGEKLDEIKRDEDHLESLKNRLKGLKGEKDRSVGLLEEKKDKRLHMQNQRELMEQYIEKSEDRSLKEKEARRLKVGRRKLKDSLDSADRDLEGSNKLCLELENRTGFLKRNQDEIKKRLGDIKDSMEGEYEKMNTDAVLEELEAEKAALEKDLGDVNMDFLQELIKNHQNNISKCEISISKRGTDKNWLESMHERVPPDRIDGLEQKISEAENEIDVKKSEESRLAERVNKLQALMEYMEEDIRVKYEKAPHIFGAITDEHGKRLNKDIQTAKKRLSKLLSELSQIQERLASLKNSTDKVSEFVADNELGKYAGHTDTGGFRTKDRVIDMWDMASIPDKTIAAFYNEAKQEYKESEKGLDNGRKNIEKEYGLLCKDSSLNMNQNIKGLISRVGETDIYNFELIDSIFQSVFKAVENLKHAVQVQLENLERDRKEMILRCLRKAQAVYEEVKSVDGFSKITIGGKKQRVIKIKTPPIYEEQAENMMGQYLDECIRELTDRRSGHDFDPAKIEDEIRKKMKPTCLMDAVAPLGSFRIEVCKPGHDMESSRYIEWEKVISWSGGEKLAGFFAMFIAIISYLRYKRTHWHESTKVIWIDNPFGQANAGYLLDYIFELANTTNTQMICLTGLQETSIYEKFDVVYSLVHRMLGPSNSVIRSRKIKSDTGMDSGMYKVNHTQMNLFAPGEGS